MSSLVFHEEIDRNGVSRGNCIAYDCRTMEGYAPVFAWPDSHVTWMEMSVTHVMRFTREISESAARVMHPNLFKRIEEDNADE